MTKHVRAFGVAVVIALALAGQALVAGVEQAPAPAATAPSGPFDSLHFRQIGPASMSGRISDLAVYEANPSIYYVGTAHGGVWKTINNGTTFEAQFQDQGLMSIGDVTISQNNPDLVWVGTGESNNRQSTSWGDGVYKSTDGGKTYVNVGLRTSKHINRIVIDPRDNDIVFVAATGSLWGPGGERGVYRTTDGGKTWKQVLKGDDDTGANDLAMDPVNSKILYASMYQRRRTACCMNGGGPGQRDLQVHRRRRNVDAAEGRPARGPARTHRARGLPAPPGTSSTRRSKARRRRRARRGRRACRLRLRRGKRQREPRWRRSGRELKKAPGRRRAAAAARPPA